VDLPVLEHLGRDSYSDPHEVYAVAKRRGMDLVTITDHDSIEGALLLAQLPDFIVGEEVTCVVPGGRHVHLNVWGIDERQHGQIAARRHDAEALFALLAEQRIPAAVNHLHVKERLMAAGSFRAYVATLPGSSAFRGPSVLGPPLALGRGA
jgi:predicted metal-dependent phosphoesterase TrpH